jgi:hypothetical protein
VTVWTPVLTIPQSRGPTIVKLTEVAGTTSTLMTFVRKLPIRMSVEALAILVEVSVLPGEFWDTL